MRLLGGMESRIVKGEKRRMTGEEIEEITKEEIKKTATKVKNGKATRLDEIPSEVWKYGEEEIMNWMWGFCNKVLKGGGMARGLERGTIIPIIKKGEGERIKDYRGVILQLSYTRYMRRC